MRRECFLFGTIFAIFGIVFLCFSPDLISFLFVLLMNVVVFLGFFMGFVKTLRFSHSFQTARNNIKAAKETQTEDIWIAVKQIRDFLGCPELDRIFDEYRTQVIQQKGRILPDLEDYINEDVIIKKTWKNVLNQIPGTLTGLGIIGTFVGLLIGISKIGFSSADAAISGLRVLLNGVSVAFYTSIVGIILSILFNILFKITWNIMLCDLDLLLDDFQRFVIPSREQQKEQLFLSFLSEGRKSCEK